MNVAASRSPYRWSPRVVFLLRSCRLRPLPVLSSFLGCSIIPIVGIVPDHRMVEFYPWNRLDGYRRHCGVLLPHTVFQAPFLAAARCAREAKLPFETLPPPRFDPADWIRDAAFPVIPFDFAMVYLLQMSVERERAPKPTIADSTIGRSTRKPDKNVQLVPISNRSTCGALMKVA